MPNWLKICFLGFGLLLAFYALFFFPKAPVESEPETLAPMEQPRAAARRIYTLTTTDAETLREEIQITPLIDELNRWLRPHEIVITAHVQKDFATAYEAFESKAVDLYYDTPAMVTIFSKQFGFDLVLVRHRDGVSQYHGVVFTNAETPYMSLKDLRGASLAAESALSTSTYFLPLDMVAHMGIEIAPLEALIDQKNPDALNVIISEQESVSLMWVLDRRVDVGVMKNTRYDALDSAVRDRLRVLARTPDLPREIIIFSRQIDPADRALLTEAFIQLKNTASGRSALRAFQRTSEFSVLESPAVLTDFLEQVISRRLPYKSE